VAAVVLDVELVLAGVVVLGEVVEGVEVVEVSEVVADEPGAVVFEVVPSVVVLDPVCVPVPVAPVPPPPAIVVAVVD
jgi:hypothetical protein